MSTATAVAAAPEDARRTEEDVAGAIADVCTTLPDAFDIGPTWSGRYPLVADQETGQPAERLLVIDGEPFLVTVRRAACVNGFWCPMPIT